MAHIGRRANRPGKLVLDWREPGRGRRYREFPDTRDGQRDAEIELGAIQRRARRGEPGIDDRTTVEDFAARWLREKAHTVEPPTLRGYAVDVARHILPAFGDVAVARLNRAMVKEWAVGLLDDHARGTVAKILRTLHTLLAAAVDDDMVPGNVADRLAAKLHLGWRCEDIKVLSAPDLGRLLDAVREVAPAEHLTLFVLAHTGLRISEAFGLQLGDIAGSVLRVERQVREDAAVARLKTACARRGVEMSAPLRARLEERAAYLRAERLASGARDVPWLLRDEFGAQPTTGEVSAARRAVVGAMRAGLDAAGLPTDLTPHCLRHTFATIHLAQGRPPRWVQVQMGHASIKITVDVYGRWSRPEVPGAADAFAAAVEAATSSKVAPFSPRK